jgi:hypothetical protein
MSDERDLGLEKMIFDLAQAINRTVSESTTVQEAMEVIKEMGYLIDLSLAVCIGLHKKGDHGIEAEKEEPITFEFNQHDLAFLKSLNIKFDENHSHQK